MKSLGSFRNVLLFATACTILYLLACIVWRDVPSGSYTYSGSRSVYSEAGVWAEVDQLLPIMRFRDNHGGEESGLFLRFGQIYISSEFIRFYKVNDDGEVLVGVNRDNSSPRWRFTYDLPTGPDLDEKREVWRHVRAERKSDLRNLANAPEISGGSQVPVQGYTIQFPLGYRLNGEQTPLIQIVPINEYRSQVTYLNVVALEDRRTREYQSDRSKGAELSAAGWHVSRNITGDWHGYATVAGDGKTLFFLLRATTLIQAKELIGIAKSVRVGEAEYGVVDGNYGREPEFSPIKTAVPRNVIDALIHELAPNMFLSDRYANEPIASLRKEDGAPISTWSSIQLRLVSIPSHSDELFELTDGWKEVFAHKDEGLFVHVEQELGSCKASLLRPLLEGADAPTFAFLFDFQSSVPEECAEVIGFYRSLDLNPLYELPERAVAQNLLPYHQSFKGVDTFDSMFLAYSDGKSILFDEDGDEVLKFQARVEKVPNTGVLVHNTQGKLGLIDLARHLAA